MPQQRGDFRVDHTEMEKQILPSKLRLIFPRRTGEEPDPPQADFSDGWGGRVDALHADIKVPSEHWMNGRQFAAEYQIYHLHRTRKMAPVVSVLVDIHPNNIMNPHLQRALDEWQKVFDINFLKCEYKKKKERRTKAKHFKNTPNKMSVDLAEAHEIGSTIWGNELYGEEMDVRQLRREAQGNWFQAGSIWNPYHKDLVWSIHFYGYSGSLTEPPCTQFVEWRVIDTPMLVSKMQLYQMKRLIFGHVNENCDMTSNHHDGSVARPLQDIRSRPVYQCTCRDFLSDDVRNIFDQKKCSQREYDLSISSEVGERAR